MRITAIAMWTAFTTLSAFAGESVKTPMRHVTVCTQGDFDVRSTAKSHSLASAIFSDIGVKIEWHHGLKGCPANAIQITLGDRTPAAFHPGAMAYALPYEGAHIQIFYDRILEADTALRPLLLTHVMVHEIAHILQGVARHSAQGIMKAHWTLDDYHAMLQNSLTFSREDVELIDLGLAARLCPGSPADKSR